MHGSSSVPQDLLAEIRKYGGDMKETYGVPVEEIQEAIKHGVRKINIDTDIRLAMTGAIRKYLAENPEKFDPRDYLKPAREAAKKICRERYLQFGCEGQAAKIAAQPLTAGRQALRAGRAGADGRLMAAAGAPGDDAPLFESTIRSLPLLARGKVRDNYAVGSDRLLMVASDRLSAFDVVMGEPIPGKGRVLTQMALFWFARSSATSCRTTSPATIRRASSPPTSASRCAAARCWSSA